MSEPTPITLFAVNEHRHDQYRVRTFPDPGGWWYCELLKYDCEFLTPGHLCGRTKPIKYVVLGIHPMTGIMSIYYGGRDRMLSHRIARHEAINGAWLIEVEQLPTPPNKHDYPQYQVRDAGQLDASRVAHEDAAPEHREDPVQG